MSKVYTSFVLYQKDMEKRCNIAVEKTAKVMLEKLKEFIRTEYYDLYSPILYIPRTYKFLNSAMYKMLNNQSASIGIDDDYFDYQYPSNYRLLGSDNNPSGVTGHWTGEDQVYMAEAGYHGNVNIYTDGHYWSEFKKWCDENVIDLLKKNLKEQKINIL